MKFQISNFKSPVCQAAGGGERLSVLDFESSRTDAEASGTDAEASGTDAEASGTDAEASGTDAEASGTGAEASGTGAEASGTGAEASGTDAEASGTDAEASQTCDLPQFPLKWQKSSLFYNGNSHFTPRTARSAFTLIEIMVVVSLLSLIVLALMAVFSATQRAFLSSVTQTDVLEGSRAAADLIASDLHGLTPSDGVNNGAVNFFITNNASYSTPLVQSLPGIANSRANYLQQIYILNHQNTKWWGVAYAVAQTNSQGGLYSLYRMEFPPGGIINGTNNPANLSPFLPYSPFAYFFNDPANPTNGGSHLVDGVVNFVVRSYDKNGLWITPNYTNFTQVTNSTIFSLQGGEGGPVMYSNVVPAAVEFDLGMVEDRALARARSFPNFNSQRDYLTNQVGAVHVFRQRVIIPNVDRTAYNPTNQ